MATVSDYIGKTFGAFRIDKIIGQGEEAEVFACLHEATGRYYVLRLDSHDSTLWSDKPVLPPYNYSIERNNVRGIWGYAIPYYLHTLEKLKKKNDEWIVKTPAIYGILE